MAAKEAADMIDSSHDHKGKSSRASATCSHSRRSVCLGKASQPSTHDFAGHSRTLRNLTLPTQPDTAYI